jgi:ubiquitin carboxyl-terminal hydrolase 8
MNGPLHNKGYTGLTNLGNTCFLNSCVQVLFHTYEFDVIFQAMDRLEKTTATTENSIIREFRELQTLMFSDNGVVSPNRFVHMVHEIARQKGREIFTGFAQNDLPEFLLFIIECMHNCISRSANVVISGKSDNTLDDTALQCYNMLQKIYEKEYSEIMDIFYGTCISEIWDIHHTTRHSLKPELYFMVDLPIPTGTGSPRISLYDCFNEYTKREILSGENAWLNEKTQQKEDIVKHITFWNLPKILVITIKRFSPDGQYKNEQLVDFTLDSLDLSQYISGYNPKSYVYELYGVCNHMGNVHGGHYTAFVKRSEHWVHMNDTSVNIIHTPEEVITPLAYCLFYRKKNTAV